MKLKKRMNIKKLNEFAIIPKYASEFASGMDLCANLKCDGLEQILLDPGERRLIKTGVAIELPEGFEGQVRPRSGLALKHGISLVNCVGTIDFDYVNGDVGAILINHGEFPFKIEHGDRIAQLVICPVIQVDLIEVNELGETERGSGGFGHTGIK